MAGDPYSDFVFSPTDLAADVDLPLEVRKQVLYLDAHLGTFDHWRLLGVPWNAPLDAVREAYRDKVKVFHPDRWAGRRLGHFLEPLQRVFRALTEARDVLCDEARREGYLRQTAPPQEFARLEARRLEDEARAEERRHRLARANPLVARASRVRELVERGKRALAEGRPAQAGNDFLTATGLDPRHPEARQLAAQARRLAAAQRGRERYEKAVAAEAVGNHRGALALFKDAAAADPDGHVAALAGARVALREGALEDARELAEQAVRAAPREAAAFEVLAAALHAQGDDKAARRAAERALQIDPQCEGARALARKLRWSLFG